MCRALARRQGGAKAAIGRRSGGQTAPEGAGPRLRMFGEVGSLPLPD
ncbi:hypothetical protein [Acidiphilium acidophilum]|uniref:Uncharacterized protein n=1 Tax=Acidiphilium acidophilum TaxID=76588 RepID=A0AAW9DT10_ACIAO|nr:hypothetical protein [Acidiphilium acidophilum]MDX5931787.1 hypothetical protein [Acidiphilium acidophilum]